MRVHISALATAAASVALIATLSACAPENGTSPDATPSATASLVPSPTPIATITPDAEPSATAEAATEIPEDCQSLLNASVLAELEGVPLNDPAFGASGSQPDGSLICIWGDPAADTTGLTTTISYMSRGPALDMLNELADEQDFTCYTPDEGTRCEKTWENATYPVIDGRTLYWRNGVMIDTRYSNLAPSGYTDAIVASLYG
ncbi:hypothetical protein [Microbacterium sp. C7(2022)]|uniref:hypothetical protein n=1 Tax=Microbacterium sp. C7(2022) TaxID=2992759 RepID=UPI00237AFE9A|nr:hypothetical protein [Microbacterium sp. C7(2022)]MDE0545300.1 hypothetical protein [Microbacterium sp. C7(2022)]